MINRPLKILVVLPLYGGSLPIGRYCATALREMGHTVDEFESPEFQQAHVALRALRVSGERQEQLESAFVNVLSQALYARVESFGPDLVLTMAQAPLNRQILRRLSKDGIATAMWFVEDYKLFTYWRTFAPFYEFFFVIQKEPFLEMLAEAGVKNAMYLPLAALPSFHRPLTLTSAEAHSYGADISFLGAGYPNRRKAFRAVMRRDFKIWGSDWDGDSVLAPYVQKQGERISPEESVLVYNATRINLNLHSSIKTDKLISGGDFVNPRTFELAGMGAFQLVDRRTLMEDMFRTTEAAALGRKPDAEDAKAELAVFSDQEGMERAILYYLAHPEERERLAKNARERVLRDHSYAQRMEDMLAFIRKHRPGWPAERNDDGLPADLPPELRARLAELLDRLQLTPTAAFADVIARLRQESGVLSSLETGLLFLDEWRKQYRLE